MNARVLPLEVHIRRCANGETFECFLVAGAERIGAAAFLSGPTDEEAVRAALTAALSPLRRPDTEGEADAA